MGYTIHVNCDHGIHHSRQLWPWDTPFTSTVTMGYTIHVNCDHGIHHSRQLWPWDTPFTSTVTKGYTTPFYSMLVVVINWSRDVGLSQIDVRCLRLQIWQPERYLHSAARCRLSVQLKQIFFRPSCYLWSPTVTNLLQFTALGSVVSQ